MNLFHDMLDPFHVDSDFGEYCVFVGVAKGTGLTTWTEADDALERVDFGKLW